jgi:RimJ/RimL family protein N-acetyltransferase
MTDPNFRIETSRLCLSYFQPCNPVHCEFLVRLYTEKARAQLEGRFRAEHARNGYGTYLVSMKSDIANSEQASASEKPESGKPIGTVSLMRGEGENSYTAPDLGFAILPEETRKGYAKEAAIGLLAYAKKNLGVDAVFGLFDPTNAASKGVFHSLGFEDRGVKTLKVFGGVQGAVWTLPGMGKDLSEYGF